MGYLMYSRPSIQVEVGNEWSLAQIHAAVNLLEAVPTEHERLFREIREIVVQPGMCAAHVEALTGGRLGRTVVLCQDPADMDVVELAVTFSHEARHHYTDARGRARIRPHTCVNCASWEERLSDPIYREDERLRRHLRKVLFARQAHCRVY